MVLAGLAPVYEPRPEPVQFRNALVELGVACIDFESEALYQPLRGLVVP
jgi:hypothetical protein